MRALLIVLAAAVQGGWAQSQFITIDAPGAGTGGNQGTVAPLVINRSGTIAGNYIDASSQYHGFLRTVDGAYTTIDVPGAAFTEVTGINAGGAISGSYQIVDQGFPPRPRGFVRSPDGVFQTFQVPGGYASPQAISPSGAIAGSYIDAKDPNTVAHGFVRASNGVITTFDAPGAGTGHGFGFPLQQGTFPNSINQAGTIAGYFMNVGQDGNPIGHGFIRAADGTFSTFDIPGSGTLDLGDGTFPMGIDLAGTVAGYSVAYPGPGGESGFLRAADGKVTSFGVPGAPATQPMAINAIGEITGVTTDPNNSGIALGFLRTRSGNITTFAFPGSVSRTLPYGINLQGQIVGTYLDQSGVSQGFLLAP